MFIPNSVCYVVIGLATFCDAARILGIVPAPCYSHQVTYQPIWKELSMRGHQVTTLTTDPIKDDKLVNLTEIDLHSLYSLKDVHLEKAISSTFLSAFFAVLAVYEEITRRFLSHREVQRLITNQNEKFDVVMVEFGYLSALAFAKKFEAPVIVISSIDALADLQTLMGNPTHPIVFPDPFLPFANDPSLFERFLLVGYSVVYSILRKYVHVPSQQLLIDTYFGPNYASVEELESDISLLLSNSDPVFHQAKPLVPTIIQFGAGSHRNAAKPLPKELKTKLDAAENGFVYFSLGSNVKSEDLSEDIRNVIVETFAELPYTVLWKIEADDWPNKPKNLITSKWFPQQDIMKHPKIKLFITQGGLQSMEEAIYDHVPMIGIPFMGDQSFNVNKMVHNGFGLALDHKTLRKNDFKATILEVINNPKYRIKIKKLAQLALDQPMTGVEKAVWWTEYVIRHNGTKHLRSPLLDIPFYQYYLLDVAAILLLMIAVLFSIIVFVLKSTCKLVKKLKNKKIKTN